MKILFLCSWYPSRETAKLGNFIQRHAEAVSNFCEVHVFYAVNSSVDEIQKTNKGNLTEHILYFKKKLPVLSYYRKSSTYLKELNAEVGFNLIHVQVAYPAGLLLANFHLPYVVSEHFSAYQPQSGYRWGYLRRKQVLRILNGAKYILPVSEHLGKALRNFGVKGNMQKLSNVVDTEIFKQQAQPPSRFTFLHISSLEERSKNISGILRVFEKLIMEKPDVLLKIGGDGDLQELRNKAAQIPPDNIEIIGPMEYSEVAEEMHKSSCLVMFSHFENQPCTILEALCCGLPVVSSNVGGISEEINTTNGILVEEGNESELLKAMINVTENKAYYKRPSISEKAAHKYSIPVIAKEHIGLYLNVLNEAALHP